MSSVESIIYINPKVYIYQIPPLKNIAGYKASEWDVDKPLWQGKLTVIEIENDQHEMECQLRLQDVSTGELFAIAPYKYDGKGVMSVLDSSRFFTIRVVNGTMTAVLGLGFADRNQAFEFNVALQDFRKHSNFSERLPNVTRDFSLKEGQKIHINVGGGSSISTDFSTEESSEVEIPALKPPPPTHNTSKEQATVRTDPFDDDFGDFVS